MEILCSTGERITIDEDSLVGANLQAFQLHRALFDAADMRQVLLAGAYLRAASMAFANLTEADLSGCDLRVANFSGAVLCRANLRSSELAGAEFEHADLTDANLEDCDVGGASFQKANLKGANMRCRRLEEADLAGCHHDKSTRWPPNFTPPAQPDPVCTNGFSISKK